WLATAPSSYTLSGGYGNYTLYAWAKDGAGNVSDESANSRLAVLYLDLILPTVISFTHTAADPTTVQEIPVVLSSWDNVMVTGWMITESSTAPDAGDPGWLGAEPTTYLLKAIPGTHTLYAWVKDGAGNVSLLNSGVSEFSIDYQLPAYPAQVLRTGQETCYDAAGTPIACAGTGQDGEYRYGIPWNTATRFNNNGDGTITDNATGLIWAANANPAGLVTWDAALTHVSTLNTPPFYCGRSDWRLPNIVELMSIMNYGNNDMVAWLQGFGFSNVSSSYWSSTTAGNRSYVWYYDFSSGTREIRMKTSTGYVLPVAGSASVLPRTGQTACWNSSGTSVACAGTGQDGDVQSGLAFPSPRFTDHGDGTITDNMTGLMWAEDLNLILTSYSWFDNADGTVDGRVYWLMALDFIDQLNMDVYAGYSDWRLPNSNEMPSTYAHDAALWLSSAGFVNSSVQNHWMSTTRASLPSAAFRCSVTYSQYSVDKASSSLYVWPVRGGN
ncbi:MAG: DUF1566 domain-containing protein, partial [Spirochaetes bacterium]|nr:DUF1566 domain-containing protein [Spirochaetota bacterium]